MSYDHTIIEQLKTQSIPHTDLIQKLQFMKKNMNNITSLVLV